MRFCKDGRIWGQNNKEAGSHLGILTSGASSHKIYIRKGLPKVHYWHSGGEFKKGQSRIQTEEEKLKRRETLRNMRHKLWSWKGGITPLRKNIFDSVERKEWKIKVFKRDNYTCQECFQCGGKLQSHHIISFNKLFMNFLSKYSQFSPIDDVDTLLKLAVTYEPFWNITNGKTLCKKCHRLTKNYGRKKESITNGRSS